MEMIEKKETACGNDVSVEIRQRIPTETWKSLRLFHIPTGSTDKLMVEGIHLRFGENWS